MIVKVVEIHDGPLDLPVFHVVKEVTACDNCGCQEDVVIKSFNTYEEADAYCNSLIKDGKATDEHYKLLTSTTPVGEEQSWDL
jgi:hypothetical protein